MASSRAPLTPDGGGTEPRTSARGSSTPESRRGRYEDELEAQRRDEYGGTNIGAAFFGWLVAIGITLLLTGIVGAVAAAVNSTLSVTLNEAEREAGTIGISAAIALLLVLMIGYFAGGYVAGRMSRFDGGRQGVAVWFLGLLVTLIVAVVGAVFGSQYDIFGPERINLPALPVPTDTATVGGIVALVAVLLGTLLAAFLGGKTGQRFHRKIDRVGT